MYEYLFYLTVYIQHIFNINVCTNNVIIFQKRMLIQRFLHLSLNVYFLFSRYFNKTSIVVQATFFTTLKSWWRFIKTEAF